MSKSVSDTLQLREGPPDAVAGHIPPKVMTWEEMYRRLEVALRAQGHYNAKRMYGDASEVAKWGRIYQRCYLSLRDALRDLEAATGGLPMAYCTCCETRGKRRCFTCGRWLSADGP